MIKDHPSTHPFGPGFTVEARAACARNAGANDPGAHCRSGAGHACTDSHTETCNARAIVRTGAAGAITLPLGFQAAETTDCPRCAMGVSQGLGFTGRTDSSATSR